MILLPLEQGLRLLQRARAYSLAELLISLGLLGLVLIGAQSAIMVASRASTAQVAQVASIGSAGDAIARIAEDLAVAASVPERASTSITITVPDRTGDGAPDEIRYAWSGVSGGALTFSINGSTPQAVLSSVRGFVLGYDTTTRQRPTTYYEDAATILASYSSASNLVNRRVGKDLGTTYTRAQWFTPTLPSDAVAWSVTRVQFIARNRAKVDSVFNFQIQTERNGAPTRRIECQRTISETDFPASFGPVDVYLDTCRRFLPGESVAFVMEQLSGSDHAELSVRDKSNLASTYHLYSTDGGTSWVRPNESMLYTVWGRVMRPNPPSQATVLVSVRYTLQTGDGTTLAGMWTVPNQPEIAP
jgi:hypothetical protein